MPQKTYKPNFDDVHELAKQIDRMLGALLFKKEGESRTWLERILVLTIPVNIGLIVILCISTLVADNFKLISILMCSSILIVIFTHYLGILVIVQHKEECLGFFDWCRKMYDIDENYHMVQRKRASYHVKYVHKWTVRSFKWLRNLLFADAFAITILASVIGTFLPDSIYPKYSAPLPYVLPFKNRKTWTVFFITVICQYKCALDVCTFSIFLFGYLYIVSFCILTYLNIIHDTVTMMGMQLRKEYEKDESNTDEILDMKFDLNGITLTIPEWNKLIVDQINDVNDITSKFSNVFASFFLNVEFSSFGTLFIFGLEFLVVREQYLYAFGVLTISFFLFTYCYINEKLKEKLMIIQRAFYDIPWYYIQPKDRKFLVTTLLCGKIQKGLTAAGLHSLTIERFGRIIQAAYTNCLILKDLIESY